MPPARGEVAQNFVAGGLFVLEMIVKTGSDTRADFRLVCLPNIREQQKNPKAEREKIR